MDKERQQQNYTGSLSRKKIYKSKAWKKTRIAFAMNKNCLCERCGHPIYMSGVSEYVPKEKRVIGIVHHKTYLTENNYTDDDIAYNWSNLELLCINCHNKEHMSSDVTRKGYMFDEYGNLIQK